MRRKVYQDAKLQNHTMLKNRCDYLRITAQYERERGNESAAMKASQEAQAVAAELLERYGMEF
jgi:hypothetical protein